MFSRLGEVRLDSDESVGLFLIKTESISEYVDISEGMFAFVRLSPYTAKTW